MLSTCHQIRNEARSIWFLQNEFSITITNCDDTLLKAFDTFIGDFDDDGEVSLELQLGGGKNWANLMKWCENVYLWNSDFWEVDDDMNKYESVVAAAHDIANNVVYWKQCEHALGDLKIVVQALDKGWR